MNGKDLLKSMTAIDESYIKEAENFTVHKGGITMKQQNQDFQESSEIEQKPRIHTYRNLMTAAACLLLCIGVAGGSIYSLHQKKNLTEMPSAEIAETKTESSEPAAVITETQTETKASAAKKMQTTVMTTETQESVTTETKQTTIQTETETSVKSSETTKHSEQTQTVTTEPAIIQTEPPETEVMIQHVPEILALEQEVQPETVPEIPETIAPEPETEFIPETEPVPEFAEIELQAAPLDERGLPVIPGFYLKYLQAAGTYDITPAGFPDNAPELRTFPRFPTEETRFDLNYISSNLITGEEKRQTSNDDGRSVSFLKRFYSEDESVKFLVDMIVMTSDVNFSTITNEETGDLEEVTENNLTFYPVSVNGNYGYFKVNENGSIVNMTWYQDGYSFFIFPDYKTSPYQTGIPLWYAGELLKMAESVQISE